MSAKLYFKLYANVSESVMGLFEEQIVELMEGYGRAVLSEYRAKESYKKSALNPTETKLQNSYFAQNFVICNCKEPNLYLNGEGQWMCDICNKRVIVK